MSAYHVFAKVMFTYISSIRANYTQLSIGWSSCSYKHKDFSSLHTSKVFYTFSVNQSTHGTWTLFSPRGWGTFYIELYEEARNIKEVR